MDVLGFLVLPSLGVLLTLLIKKVFDQEKTITTVVKFNSYSVGLHEQLINRVRELERAQLSNAREHNQLVQEYVRTGVAASTHGTELLLSRREQRETALREWVEREQELASSTPPRTDFERILEDDPV